MSNRIVLISDDSNFFEFMRAKLELRKSDELFTFSFESVPDKLQMLETAVLIVNSENAKENTLDLLKLFSGTPIIVFAYNEDDAYRRKCYRAGMFDYMTLLTSDSDFRARMIPALTVSALLDKNKQYRSFLVKQNILKKNNEVFLDYTNIIDTELTDINEGKRRGVFMAISPADKGKFLVQSTVLESIILSYIRNNDILMNYAPNKYFLLMFDTDVKSAQKVWNKMRLAFPQKMYAGFCNISNQKRQQLINEALNKLHEAINYDDSDKDDNPIYGLSIANGTEYFYSNFKMFRQKFERKVEQVINPVFYRIQQKYSHKLMNVTLEQGSGEDYGTFYIKGKHVLASFKITTPGFSKINIDISHQNNSQIIDSKRITLEPEELESGLLEDLLEQFIIEYRRLYEYDS